MRTTEVPTSESYYGNYFNDETNVSMIPDTLFFNNRMRLRKYLFSDKYTETWLLFMTTRTK